MPKNIIKCLILLRKPIPCSHTFSWWSKDKMACLAVSFKILLKICSFDFCALWISLSKCGHAFSCCFVVYSFNICWWVIVLYYSFSVLVAKALFFYYHPMFWLLHIIRYIFCFWLLMQPFLDVNNDEDSLEHDGDGRWPFHSFFEQLILDIFDPGKQFPPPPSSIVLFLVGVGEKGGGVLWVHNIDLSSGSLCFLFSSFR